MSRSIKQADFSSRFLLWDCLVGLSVIVGAPISGHAAIRLVLNAQNNPSCEAIDVQRTINQAQDGDIVQVGPGVCTWTTQVLVDLQNPPRSLTIQSAGVVNDPVKNRPISCATTIIDGITIGDWAGMLFKIISPANKSFRLTGFEFKGSPNTALINIGGDTNAFRIDHNIFNHDNNQRSIFPTGRLTGVIDHNIFGPGVGQAVAMFGEGLGHESWATPHSFGTGMAIYIEDNDFKCQLVTDGWRGARYVIRYNDIETKVIPAQNHGTESGGGIRSAFSMEVYNNNVKLNDGHTLFYIRGGIALFHHNKITGPNVTSLGNLVNFRSWDGWETQAYKGCFGNGPFDINDNVVYAEGTATEDMALNNENALTTSPNRFHLTANQSWSQNWDGYSIINSSKGWGSEISSSYGNKIYTVPSAHIGNERVAQHAWSVGDRFQILRVDSCMDQVGRGTGRMLTEDSLRNGVYDGSGIGPVGPYIQAIEPVYSWGNTINAVPNNTMQAKSYMVKKGRDYIEGVARPGYTPFVHPHPLVQMDDPPPSTPPSIISPPSNQYAVVGQAATFSIYIRGSPPLRYQWKKNGLDVGTNSSLFKTPALNLANSGEKYICVVSNNFGTVASNEVTLTVTTVPIVPPPNGGGGNGEQTAVEQSGSVRFGIFKNVFFPIKGEILAIRLESDVSEPIEIKILDSNRTEVISMKGDVVKGVGGSFQWDGKNGSGALVASGTYSLFLRSNSGKQTKKVVVVK